MTSPPDQQPQGVSYALPVHKPVITWVLLGAIVVAFIAETLAGGSTQTDVLIRLGAKVTPYIAAGEYWRFFTSMFLHIGPAHLLFNGYALVVIGTELERMLGWERFLAIYLISGLYGGLASYAFSINVTAGASGAIFGSIGALAAFFALYRRKLGSWGQSRLANIAFLIALNLFLGFTQKGIDNLAHLGGLVSGLGLGWALAPRYKVEPLASHIMDQNRLGKYWPALGLAVVILVGGVALTTLSRRDGAQGHLWLATYAIEREAWDEVAVELEQVLAKEPALADSGLYFQLGLAHSYLGNLESAAEAYLSSLEMEPGDPAVHWNLGQTYLQMQRYAQAQSHFEFYRDAHPDEADAHFYVGLIHSYLGQLDLAVEAYESALALDPDHDSSHWNVALAYFDLGRYSAAQSHYLAYLELRPDEIDEVQYWLDQIPENTP